MLRDADEDFARNLPEGVVRPLTEAYLTEPRGRWRGQGGVVAAPRSVDEVAAVLRAAQAARVPVVTRGGGTGLVSGQVMPDAAPLILSLVRMARVRAVYPAENVLVAEAGVTLQAVRDAAEDVGRLFPLALASQGSATVGGVLATNAGGVNVLRYGNARALCLGVEAVLSDGRVINGLQRLRKDNTGYDLRDLLIGSEGTLGVITAASLALSPRPAAQAVMMLVVPDPAAALDLLALAGARLAGCVSAFELISGQGLRFLDEVLPLRQPFDPRPDWLVLLELGLPEGLDPEVTSEGLVTAAMAGGLVLDGVIAQSGQQAAEFWHVRESLPEANRRIGSISSHDISLPLSEIPDFLRDAGAMLAGMGVRINAFGHLGDGNLHYNVFPAPGRSRADYDAPRVQELVHDMVVSRGGSFSAEHGIGRLKTKDLARWGDPARVQMMAGIKALFDPAGILNPGVILPAVTES
ncbi:MAG: FAD-binding oxidoreductase [Paracoccus sp. (in: a-proteobacteria)]|uniref:FAD-binding oxidoreductase n=1 Tax=Paracoccus sp. TaxID=267 RepID=UPI0026E07FA5|nr:FAD-binding oxidoreductase [Paracoccus sp. (in: a-proteobacteria)]MDO5620074.1 FAD-binding oxidoreductase [Paracoccus sp. (in: a-proteobacteria)]